MLNVKNYRFRKIILSLIAFSCVFITAFLLVPATQIVKAAEPVVLTVRGDGVSKEVQFTMSDLRALPQKTYTYSGYNHWPALKVFKDRKGPTLKSILEVAGLKDNATLLKFKPSGGKYVHVDFTKSQLIDEQRYYFPDGEDPGDVVSWPPKRSEKGKVPVETIIALDDSNGRICFGQRAPNEPTGGDCVMIQEVCNNGVIEVSTESLKKWEAPSPNQTAGKVAAGSKISLIKADNIPDNVMMYYTLDGSEPDYGTNIFNISYPSFQPAFNAPIVINKNITIKAKTIGFGKLDSDTVTFQYTVDKIFTDIDNHWASADINYLADKGVIKSTDDMKFKPDDIITRAEFAEILANALNLEGDGSTITFKDIAADSEYRDSIAAVVKKGLIMGYSDTCFAPNDKITREQISTIAARSLKLSTGTVISDNLANQALAKFKDKDVISGWAKQSVGTVVYGGLMKGTNDTTFAPKTVLTRAQAATLMARLYKQVHQDL